MESENRIIVGFLRARPRYLTYWSASNTNTFHTKQCATSGDEKRSTRPSHTQASSLINCAPFHPADSDPNAPTNRSSLPQLLCRPPDGLERLNLQSLQNGHCRTFVSHLYHFRTSTVLTHRSRPPFRWLSQVSE